MRSRSPPTLLLAVGYVTGALLPTLPGSLSPFLLLVFFLPIALWSRTARGVTGFVFAVLAGIASGAREPTPPCTSRLRDGSTLQLSGWVASQTPGGSRQLQVGDGLPPGCRGLVRVVGPSRPGQVRGGGATVGQAATVSGTWRSGRSPSEGGVLFADHEESATSLNPLLPRAVLLRLRGWAWRRLRLLYPERHSLASGLILARKEGISPERRNDFAVSGVAHLLAISGFHVGVIAAIAVALTRSIPGTTLRAVVPLTATWLYVALIGAPEAAVRACLLLSLAFLGRVFGRRIHAVGALASALLAFGVMRPGSLLRPGVQLSFAGAFGLAAWSGAIEEAMANNRSLRHLPKALRSGLAAGLSATVATAPIAAWHFDRFSIVGLPVTLITSPLVAMAIPGIILSLVVSAVSAPAGAFLAGGVDVLLWSFDGVVAYAASLPWAAMWIPRPWVLGGLAGAVLGARVIADATRFSVRTRVGLRAIGILIGVTVAPIVGGALRSHELELITLDVGQGDALLLRTPQGRWVLIDTGPRARGRDAGRRVIVPYLLRRGATRLDLMVLSHPDLDHIGGAPAVLRTLEVGAVVDPGLPVGKGIYVDLLEIAKEHGVPWDAVHSGQVLEIDDVKLTVLHPSAAFLNTTPPPSANDASVVLMLEYGGFRSILTGDAPVEVEEIITRNGWTRDIDVLKVGHHGSRTSTSWTFLAAARPEVALISAGAGNSFGHPHPEVMQSLAAAGVETFRTDQQGTLRVRVRGDGSYTVQTER